MREFVVVILSISIGVACSNREPLGADLLIHNARVYTVDDLQPWAEAVAIRGDRIVWVGSDAEADGQKGDRTRVIDAEGRLLLPGFVDSHNHIRYGNESNSVDLNGARTLGEIRNRIRAFSHAHPELPWISGGGWSYEAFPGDGLPLATYLTGITGRRPAVFFSNDAHTVWLNMEAMEAIGLTPDSDLAQNELVVKHVLTGHPSGVVNGDVSLGRANEVLNRLWEEMPEDDGLYESLEASLAQALGYGITTIVAPQTNLEELSTFLRARDSRHQLVHVEVVSSEDIPRFHELGVVAWMQPLHIVPDDDSRWLQAVGAERAKLAFPWRSLYETGATIAFSSDWDVSEMNPLLGIYTAITRKSVEGNPAGGWIPEQTIALETAIRAYTLDGAFANFAEKNRGSISVGKYADLVLLSQDLFEIPLAEILNTQVILTLVGGEVVYSAP